MKCTLCDEREATTKLPRNGEIPEHECCLPCFDRITVERYQHKIALAVCQRFAETLQEKGLKAFFGSEWDGATKYHGEPLFWYFHPRGNGGVGAYVEYDGGTYDMGFLDPGGLLEALKRAQALGPSPSRNEVWEAFHEALTRE